MLTRGGSTKMVLTRRRRRSPVAGCPATFPSGDLQRAIWSGGDGRRRRAEAARASLGGTTCGGARAGAGGTRKREEFLKIFSRAN